MNEFYRVGKQTNIHKCHKMKDEPRKAKAIRVYSVSRNLAGAGDSLQWNLQIFAPEGIDDMVATATLTRDDIADLHTHLGAILRESNPDYKENN